MIKKIKELLRSRKTEAAFTAQFQQMLNLEKGSKKRFLLDKENLFPILTEATVMTGFDRHYVYHPAWAARIIRKTAPSKHIDISSTLHFCSILSAFIPVEFYDYRPANLALDNLKALHADLSGLLFESNSIASISCMHTVEHIGLGRYGDPMDYDGDLKAINELKRVLAPNGTLLFVVPLAATDRIYFNAHRVYSKQQVLELFADLELQEFALIPEDENDGGLVVDPNDTLLEKQSYGCGCFWFKKQP